MALRAEVLAAAAQVDEKWIKGWRALAYGQGHIRCHLKLRKASVELAFYHGATLHDPQGVLKGKGRRRRHLSVPLDPALLPLEQVRDFLQQTFPTD